jgi:hypothetical protein
MHKLNPFAWIKITNAELERGRFYEYAQRWELWTGRKPGYWERKG